MKAETIIRLNRLGLSSEQMAGVLALLAEELAPLERIRASAAQRQSKHRKDVVSRDGDATLSRDNHVTASRDSHVTPRALYIIPITETVDNSKIIPPLPPKPQNPPPADTRVTFPDGFEEFWDAYPPRAGNRDKLAAVRAYKAALKRASAGTIITGARAYRAYVQAAGQERTQFVRQARTWLNGNGWTENYDTSQINGPRHGKPTDRTGNLAALIGDQPGGF